jgi:hypothetical protein
MTTTEQPLSIFETVTFDLYKDIHKGIRSLLFSVTGAAGCLDPADDAGRADLATQVHGVLDLLVMHAEHEDKAIQPALGIHLPALAERVETDHVALDARLVELTELADVAAGAGAAQQRAVLHRLYLDLASFTSAYLVHQDVEERVIMPALEQTIGVPAVVDMHVAIISSIPPDVMAASLALMLPAMNVDDRVELLGGMRASAPPEVFEGVWGLAASVLTVADHRAVGVRLGLGT